MSEPSNVCHADVTVKVELSRADNGYDSVNWATGLPGVQPKWESEFSVFVGDIGRETTEAELVVSSFTRNHGAAAY